MGYRDGIGRLRARKALETPLDAEEMQRRFDELKGGRFDDADLLGAFSDVFDAVCAPPNVRFAPDAPKCSLDCERRTVLVEGDLISAAGDKLARIVRELDFANGVAHHGQLIVAKDFRGVGLAAVLLDHALGFYQRVAITEIVLTAALTMGPYYWAKLGFDFEDARDSRQMQHWFARVNAQLDLGLDCIAERKPRAWSQLGIDEGVDCSLGEISERFPEARDRIATRAADIGLDLDERIHAGKAVLLSGPNWNGRLAVSSRARSLVQTYIAAKGTKLADALRPDRTSDEDADSGDRMDT